MNLEDPSPPFEELAAVLQADVQSGEIGSGAQLPSYHDLVITYCIAPNTVKSALAGLRAEGLIVSWQGSSFLRIRNPAASEMENTGFVDDLWEALAAPDRRLDDLEQ